MDQSATALSRTLEGLSRALAEWTVNRHAEQDTTLPYRYGANWRASWVAAVCARLEYLCQSIAVRRPALFAGMMSWEASAYRARDASLDDLSRSLECLRSVVASELPQASPTVEPHLHAGLAAISTPPSDADRLAGEGGPWTAVTLAYLEAILDSRSGDALRLILQQLQNRAPVRDLYLHVLRPATSRIGHMWHRGEITVSDEHMATATTQLVLSALRMHFPKDVMRHGSRVVLATLSGDYHEIGLRMAADLLEMDGWEVRYLGTNMPGDEIIEYLQREPSHLLTLGVGSCLKLRATGEMIQSLNAGLSDARPRVLVGGPPFEMVDDLWNEIGADGCAHGLEDVPVVARQLIAGHSR